MLNIKPDRLKSVPRFFLEIKLFLIIISMHCVKAENKYIKPACLLNSSKAHAPRGFPAGTRASYFFLNYIVSILYERGLRCGVVYYPFYIKFGPNLTKRSEKI